MKRILKIALCALPLLVLAGCNAGVDEEPPPKTAPEMTPEEKKKMEEEMKKQMGGTPGAGNYKKRKPK